MWDFFARRDGEAGAAGERAAGEGAEHRTLVEPQRHLRERQVRLLVARGGEGGRVVCQRLEPERLECRGIGAAEQPDLEAAGLEQPDLR